MRLVLLETEEIITDETLAQMYPDMSEKIPGYWDDNYLAQYGVELLRNDPYPDRGLLESLREGEIRKDADGHFYQTWILVPADPQELVKYIRNLFRDQVFNHMNNVSVENGFYSVLDAASYAGESSVPRLQKLGLAFRKWRSLVWDYADTQIPLIASKQRPQPTIEEFLAELPALALPA
jgi:hypothetical protein